MKSRTARNDLSCAAVLLRMLTHSIMKSRKMLSTTDLLQVCTLMARQRCRLVYSGEQQLTSAEQS